jgi:excisionase family DNA binding protein
MDVRDGLLTVRQVALFLQVHEKTVYRLVSASGLPCVRIGGRLRFRSDDVLRWVSARKEG